jgi:hypothetical protein
MVQTAGGNVNLIRPTVGLVGEGRAASVAESSKCAGVGFVSTRPTGFPFEVRTFYDDPGHGLRTGSATAVFAMTIRADTHLSFYREPNFPAITSASDYVYFMT